MPDLLAGKTALILGVANKWSLAYAIAQAYVREGGKLIYELMTHITQDRYTYVSDWTKGELVIYDNRSVLHAPSWYEADKYIRIMWRTTVMGNPGPEYAGERPSWIPHTEAAE